MHQPHQRSSSPARRHLRRLSQQHRHNSTKPSALSRPPISLRQPRGARPPLLHTFPSRSLSICTDRPVSGSCYKRARASMLRIQQAERVFGGLRSSLESTVPLWKRRDLPELFVTHRSSMCLESFVCVFACLLACLLHDEDPRVPESSASNSKPSTSVVFQELPTKKIC